MRKVQYCEIYLSPSILFMYMITRVRCGSIKLVKVTAPPEHSLPLHLGHASLLGRADYLNNEVAWAIIKNPLLSGPEVSKAHRRVMLHKLQSMCCNAKDRVRNQNVLTFELYTISLNPFCRPVGHRIIPPQGPKLPSQ